MLLYMHTVFPLLTPPPPLLFLSYQKGGLLEGESLIGGKEAYLTFSSQSKKITET